jgi:hypothetical protein
MRSTFGQHAAGAMESRPPSAPATSTRELPYDHVATFVLAGRRGNRIQDVINVSIDGTYVATAVGYSFVPVPLVLPALPAPDSSSSSLAPTEAVANYLLEFAAAFPTAAAMFVNAVLPRLCGIDFRYSIVDSATGRELQNKPIHNIAGLGEANGSRPFRPLAKPMAFMPRSTIRIEVEELSEGPIYTGGQLYLVLHGYKILA